MPAKFKVPPSYFFPLAAAGLGQTTLLALAWGFLGAVWARGPIPLPYPIAQAVYNNPTETMLVTTFIGTLLAQTTTRLYTLALKEALKYHMHLPTPLIQIISGITLAQHEPFFNQRHMRITIISIVIFFLACFMGHSPTLVAWNIQVQGTEVDLNSTYFESQLGLQLVSSGSALPPLQGNSLETIDNGGLMSGIIASQQSVGISEVLSFNGVSYRVSTGGVIAAVSAYASSEMAEQTNTGLGYVGGQVSGGLKSSPYPAIASNYTLIQQGLTADVTCTEIPSQVVSLVQTASVPLPVNIFNSVTYLNAYGYNTTCDQGNPAQQGYVIRSSTNNETTGNIFISLVCPYPVGQSGLDWSKFYVISQGVGKYEFLRSTTCKITPKLTVSQVTYANRTLNTTILSSTPSSPSHNSNLTLFLASIVQYQAQNSQGLGSNSIGDALYAIAQFTDIVSNDGVTLNSALIVELEDYWRGVIEFFGTYLRSGFSAYPIVVPSGGQSSITGYHTVTTMGWSKSHPIYLYTVLPITLFTLFTYAAIGYALFRIVWSSKKSGEIVTFDPMDLLQLILASSTVERSGDMGQTGAVEACEEVKLKPTNSVPWGVRFLFRGNQDDTHA